MSLQYIIQRMQQTEYTSNINNLSTTDEHKIYVIRKMNIEMRELKILYLIVQALDAEVSQRIHMGPIHKKHAII